MTIIENNSPKQIYIGPFSKDTPIPLTFPYISKHHVHAMMNDIEIIQPSDFEVIENSIKLTADWPKDSTLTVYRITTLDQQSPFPQQSKFRSERIEQALDKLCMQNQEQEEQLGRTVKVPISKKTFDGTMPYPVPGRTLKINSDASGFELSELDVDDAYAQTNQYKIEAQLARDEATNQANIATSQAGIAADKANASANSATQAAETLAVAVTTITTEKEEAVEAVQNQQVNSINAVKSQQNASVDALKAEGTTQVNLAKAEVTKATNQANDAKNYAAVANSAAETAKATLNAAEAEIAVEKTNAINAVKTQQSTSISAVQNQQTSSVNTVKATGQSYIDKCKAWASSNNVVESGLRSAKYYAEQAQGKSDVTYNHLRASRVYDDKGAILTDEEGYAEVLKKKQSTFDLSKFTVVGTPTITDDGVASEFSPTNSIKTAQNIDLTTAESWEIICKVNISGEGYSTIFSIPQYNKAFRLFTYQRKIGFNIPISGDDWGSNSYTSNVLALNTDYYLKLELKNGYYTSYYSQDGIIYTQGASMLKDRSLVEVHPLQIGGRNNNIDPLLGSIDLRQFSITVDGKEVFNGNKIGLDVIKEDNYTIVGSPVISDDGILNSQPNSFVKVPFPVFQNLEKTLVIEGSFICAKMSGEHWICATNFNFDLAIVNIGDTLRFRFPTLDDNGQVVSKQLSYNKLTNFKEGDKIDFKLDLSLTSVNLTVNNETVSTSNANLAIDYLKGLAFVFGNTQNNNYYTNGFYPNAIDLNSFKIYIDGQLVYQPCFKIPYTLSDKGSKIVPAYARDRVQDVYEQYGNEYSYYTIDEENKNFTLPIGNDYDNSARPSLENLGERGNEKLATSLMYETGKVSNDEKGFNQLAKMNKSTFDLSKFTVVGSPTITSDGIVSGFSSSNYVKIPMYNLTYTNEFKLRLKLNIGSDTNALECVAMIKTSTDLVDMMIYKDTRDDRHSFTLRTREGEGSTTYWSPNWQVSKFDSSWYIIELVINEGASEKTFNIYDENGVCVASIKGQAGTISQQPLTEIGIGYLDDSYDAYTSSIDLKQLLITVDGKEVFNGNKNGLDVIKEDNFEIVGSPMISDDGIVSGFSKGNYIYTPTISLAQKNWEIVTPTYRFSSTPTSNRALLSSRTIAGFHIYYANSNTITIDIGDGTGWGAGLGTNIQTNFVPPLNTDMLFKLKFIYGEGYYFYYSFDGVNFTLLYKGSTTSYIPDMSVNVGINRNADGAFLTDGYADLNSFKIYVNDQLVYQPCLKIPYNVSKTGSKIVPAYARDRVIDLYEQEGHAGYYTIDEENKNFTLPMGEIFGLIGQRSLRSVTRDGANYCEIYSDKTIEQGGTCAANVEVTLQQPFADTNYVLSVPYSNKTATSFIPTQTGDWIAKGKGV